MEETMRLHTLALLAGTIAVASVGSSAAASSLAARSPSAETFYGCSSGYTFEVNSNAARCHKPASERIQPLANCQNYTVPVTGVQVGLFPKADHSGNTDYCAGQSVAVGLATNTLAFVRTCAEGLTKRVQPGTDVCFRRIPESTIAPTVAVTR
jgi:hypothetical protein